MKIKLVILDLDGTIYKSESTFIPAIQNALLDFGLPHLAPKDILPFLRYNAREYSERFTGSEDVERIEAFRNKVRHYELRDIPVVGALFPGVEDTLDNLKGLGSELAICTNADKNYLDAVINKTGIRQYFTALVGNDSGRPKADLVREILTTLDYSPVQCVVVGDSDSDQIAALRNNVVFIEAVWGYGNATIINPPYRIKDMRELPEVLKAL